ncbi:hypothetical protein B0H14DRAFT_2575489 [Mycena olivaceomarginata]|nr:hypothetical protein B0H14DRAFT_2575489 [Mycena olivaceomarginata]
MDLHMTSDALMRAGSSFFLLGKISSICKGKILAGHPKLRSKFMRLELELEIGAGVNWERKRNIKWFAKGRKCVPHSQPEARRITAEDFVQFVWYEELERLAQKSAVAYVGVKIGAIDWSKRRRVSWYEVNCVGGGIVKVEGRVEWFSSSGRGLTPQLPSVSF